MYRGSILALLVMFTSAGWSAAQLPANLQMSSASPSAFGPSTVSLTTPLQGTTPRNRTLPAGNGGLPAGLQGTAPGTPNLGMAEARFPANFQRTATDVAQSSISLGNPVRGTMLHNGNAMLPVTLRTSPLSTGNVGLLTATPRASTFPTSNGGLPAGLQVPGTTWGWVPSPNNLGTAPLMPFGSQANVPFRGYSNTFVVNGGGVQQPLSNLSMGTQGTRLWNGNATLPSTFRSGGLPTANRGTFNNLRTVPFPSTMR